MDQKKYTIMKSKRNKTLKISAFIVLVIFAGLAFVYMYVSKVGRGSNEGILPTGYTLVEANGYSFTTKLSGDKQDIPVILLHGFPESSVIWNRLTADLTYMGYYTVAFDQRGYSFKARPDEASQYEISHLASDVIAMADALGIKEFHLIGHDWGSAVGWQVASDYPARLKSFTSLSIPHLAAFSRAYIEDSIQHTSSKYIRDFQTNKVPEYMLAKNDYEVLRSIWSAHDEDEIASYINLFSQEKALSSAINWYRANYNLFVKGFDTGKIDVPVLFIWGNEDKAVQRSGVEWTKSYVSDYYRFVEVNAGHWLMQESYEEVQKEIVQHLEKF